MIVDTFANNSKYRTIHPEWDKAFEIIQKITEKPIPEGANIKEVIDGIQLRMQTYISRNADEKLFEAHRHCVDIQYIAEGKEVIYWTKTDGLETAVPYSEERDHMSLKEPSEGICPIYLKQGDFAVFFPGDAHKTQCRWGENAKVVKIIMKLPI